VQTFERIPEPAGITRRICAARTLHIVIAT
jgi:hypothetical protein